MNEIRKKGVEKISALLDIEFNYSHAKHNFELGLPLEESLRHFFRPYFPNRYGFSSGYIVDENGTISNQSDWIIYDSNNFAPLMAQIHGGEGAEWFPFDSVYGCVEVKRKLTEEALDTAIKQISATRKLQRSSTNLLQITPYFRLPEGFINVGQGVKFDEVCNSLYIGIYAYSAGDYENPETLQTKLGELLTSHGPESLPDFIAVHGRYYVRRANFDKATLKTSVQPFKEQTNCYITVNTGKLTAGVFYNDLIYQFANTHLSATINTTAFGSFMTSNDEIRFTGNIVLYDIT